MDMLKRMSGELAECQKHVTAAMKALEGGDRDTASAEMNKAQATCNSVSSGMWKATEALGDAEFDAFKTAVGAS